MWIKSLHEQIHRMIKSTREPCLVYTKKDKIGFILSEWLTDHSLIKQAICVVYEYGRVVYELRPYFIINKTRANFSFGKIY